MYRYFNEPRVLCEDDLVNAAEGLDTAQTVLCVGIAGLWQLEGENSCPPRWRYLACVERKHQAVRLYATGSAANAL